MELNSVLHGDALHMLKLIPDNSIDALITDPPAGINFMNMNFDKDRGGRKQWIEWLTGIMQEVYRTLRPGAHGLVWALPRTSHWTGTALEDAGFEIRDSIYHLYSKHDKLQAFMATLNDEQRAVFETLMEDEPIKMHLFGSGFPKSHDISKAIDRHFKAEREVIGKSNRHNSYRSGSGNTVGYQVGMPDITAPATPEAQQWEGWGSAMKPSCEVWWLIRKPLSEASIAKNVLEWGTGAINIDSTRVNPGEHVRGTGGGSYGGIFGNGGKLTSDPLGHNLGRWPSHLLLTHTLLCKQVGVKRVKGTAPRGKPSEGKEVKPANTYSMGVHVNTDYADSEGYETIEAWECVEYCPVALLDEQSGNRKSGGRFTKEHETPTIGVTPFVRSKDFQMERNEGGASRYFKQLRPDVPFIYASKASRKDRTSNGTVNNTHPTCKSTTLMSYMLKLITPPNGVVLDCFAGSGSTLIAAIHEGFHYVGIEQEAEYIEIINSRITHALSEKNKEVA